MKQSKKEKHVFELTPNPFPLTLPEALLQKLHAIFRRTPCVFCRFRKDRDLVGTQLNRLNALKHSHKSVIEKCSGFGLHGPKN